MSRVEILAPEEIQRLSSALQAAAYEYAEIQESGDPTLDLELHWCQMYADQRISLETLRDALREASGSLGAMA